jgi:PTH2 family peptidyl-tRNA hydrolase
VKLPLWFPRIEVAGRNATVPAGAQRLVIRVNTNANMSRGKYAAQAVHAALYAVGAHPGVPVVVLGAGHPQIETMPHVVRDAGRTAGAEWEVRP